MVSVLLTGIAVTLCVAAVPVQSTTMVLAGLGINAAGMVWSLAAKRSRSDSGSH